MNKLLLKAIREENLIEESVLDLVKAGGGETEIKPPCEDKLVCSTNQCGSNTAPCGRNECKIHGDYPCVENTCQIHIHL